jgi:hypothetical protein
MWLCGVAFLSFPPAVHSSPSFANAVTNGIVNIAGLTEASGIIASRNNPNVLWTHNDSGHPEQIFALDTQGRLLGTYSIPGNTDNEDIAIGPGPVTNVSYLYIGDIGDNAAARANIKVYQIPEPAVHGRQYTNPASSGMKGARTITLTYPDGARDAEAMFVDPITGDLFILTKASTSRVYTASKSQLDTNNSFTLTFVRTLAFNVPDAADISPNGGEIIVRQENLAGLWVRTNGQSINSAFGGTAISIPVTGVANGEPNGEALTFDSVGSGYFTISEGTTQPLRHFARTTNDGPGPPPRTLIAPGSTWKYLDNGSNQGITWREPGFNDTSWSKGVAQFGYGDGDEETVISYGGNPNNKFITTYFRKPFTASNAADVTNLVLRLVLDDGAAVFLNGTPVVSEGLSPGAAYDALASPMPVALQSTWRSYPLDARLLVEGTNVIAVEVHQSSVTSSNISFDLQLLVSDRSTAYEPFDYPVGTALVAVTNASGQWWTAAGAGPSPAAVAADSLSVPGLANSHAQSLRFGASNSPSARFNLISNITSGTLYYSLALQVANLGALTTNGGWFAGCNNSRGAQANTPTVLGNRILARTTSDGGFKLGVAKNSTNSTDWIWAANLFNTNETIFLVGSYTFNTNSAADDIASLWINPSMYDFGASIAPAPTLVATSGPDINANQIASFVFLQQGLNNTNQPAALNADELRIGTSWASVTPPGAIRPVLDIALSASLVVLSWVTNAVGFSLQAAPALYGANIWTNVPDAPAISAGAFRITNAAPAGATLYRLIR